MRWKRGWPGKRADMGGFAESAAPLRAAAKSLLIAALALAAALPAAARAQAISLSPSGLPMPTAGFAYQQTVTASGGEAPYVFSIEAGMLPPGLTLAPGGQISGTATLTAPFVFTLYGTDFNGREGSVTATMAAAAALALANPTLVYQVGQAVHTQITAANGTPPYGCSTSSSMPPGLALSSACLLSGNAGSVGSSVLAIHMVDANGVQGNVNLSVVVAPVLALANPTLRHDTQSPFSFVLAAANGVGPYSCTALGALPPGVSLSPTCVLSGSQVLPGTYVIRLHLVDNIGAYGDADLTLVLADPTVIPVNSAWMLALMALLLAAVAATGLRRM